MLLVQSAAQAQAWYDVARKGFAIASLLMSPSIFFIDAPFGRFSLNQSIFQVDGIKSWIVMELVAPLALAYAYLHSPLSAASFGSAPSLSLAHPANVLALLFLAHYANRAVISPLRTPSRAKSHIGVAGAAVVFNTINGSLMGAYFSSPAARTFLSGAYERPTFWAGVALWAFGLAGNIIHDEVLLNIRRTAAAKGKGKEGAAGSEKPHYAVPHGYLYRFISFPNYFCEWVEWAGFALAAGPAPSFASGAALLASLTPPHVFVLSEVCLMLPRAVRGHQWYRARFPDYPAERKAVIPFVL